MGEYSFRIRGDDPEFLPLCNAIYPNSAWAGGDGADPLYRLVREPRGLAAAYSRRQLLKRSRSGARLLVPLEWWITYDILRSHPQNVHIHGGGFRTGGGAVLLPGGHGAGKTSLTLEALYRGYQVYSDEILVVDPDRIVLRPYPRCFIVKEPGMRLFPHLHGLYRTRGPQKAGRSVMVWYVNPREIRPDYLAPAAPCGWLLFPRFRAGAPTRLTPLSELEVVGKLLSCVFTFFLNTDATLTGVTALARRCRAYDLEFGELRPGFDAIEDLLAGRGTA
ncbi:MAG: hypothetical protein L0214_14780 [candidate division NC10 bacterium]|nr:hypothetical protein [candidate division NC10 bacterium]